MTGAADREAQKRALLLSLLALAVPVGMAGFAPEEFADYEALLWLLGLVPAFLFAYQRGWRGAGSGLALGMALLSVTYATTSVLGQPVPDVLAPVVVAWVVIALGVGWMAEAFHRERRTRPGPVIDPDTGLPTRLYAETYLESEWDAACRGRPLVVVLFALDDPHGSGGVRDGGIVRRFTGILRANTRRMNVSARFAEEPEFITVLGGSDLQGAAIFAQRVVQAFDRDGSAGTVSAGVASYHPTLPDIPALLRRAREARSRAQVEGGNRVRVHGVELPEAGWDGNGVPAPAPGTREGGPPPTGRRERRRGRRLLLVGEAATRREIRTVVDADSMELRVARELKAALSALHRELDVVLLDLTFPDALDVVDVVQQQNPATQVVGIVPEGRTQAAVDALHHGVAYCLVAPLDRPAVEDAVDAALARRDRVWQDELRQSQISGELRARTRAAERSLAETEARYRSMVEEIREVVYRVDAEGRWVFLNRAWEVLSGRSVESTLDTPFTAAFDPRDRETVEALLHELLSGEARVWQGRVRVARIPGGVRWVDLSASPFFSPAGGVAGIQGVLTDIQDRKRLEDQLHQAQKMEAVGRLAGGIAHDFNNILTAVRGHAELLLDDADPGGTARKDLEEILRGADRAAALTRQLISFGRRAVQEPREMDVPEALEEMATMLRRLIGEDTALILRHGEGPTRIRMDPSQFEQVVLNLVVNGAEAIPAGGDIVVETEGVELGPPDVGGEGAEVVPGRFVRLTVTDTGHGMGPEVLERAFEPFFSTKEGERASGLGLSVIYGIVRQNGGFVRVSSTLGEGSTFRVYLPAVEG